MSEPIYDETTERLYGRLPDVMRRDDETVEWHLKTYVSAMVKSQAEVDVLIERFQFIPPEERAQYGGNDTSDLVDPMTADAAWLPWIAQLVGVDITGLQSEAEVRSILKSGASGFRAGSLDALTETIQDVLTGSKYVRIYQNSNATDPIGSQDEWSMLIVTKTSETPPVSEMVEMLTRKGAKPAGVLLFHRTYEAPWDLIESTYPTWADIEAVDWATIEETGLA